MNDLLRSGDEKTDRLLPVEVIALNLPVQINQNLAGEVGVANGPMGKIFRFEFFQETTF